MGKNQGDLLLGDALKTFIKAHGGYLQNIDSFELLNKYLPIFDGAILSEERKKEILKHFKDAIHSNEYDTFLNDIYPYLPDKDNKNITINSYRDSVVKLEEFAAREGKSLYNRPVSLFARLFRRTNTRRVINENKDDITLSLREYYTSFKQFSKANLDILPNDYFTAIHQFHFFNDYVKRNYATIALSDEIPKLFLHEGRGGSKELFGIPNLRNCLGNEAADMFERISIDIIHNIETNNLDSALFDDHRRHVSSVDLPVEGLKERVDYTNMAISFAAAQDIELTLGLIKLSSTNLAPSEKLPPRTIRRDAQMTAKTKADFNKLLDATLEEDRHHYAVMIENSVNKAGYFGLRKADLERRIINNMKKNGNFSTKANFYYTFEQTVQDSIAQQDKAISYAVTHKLINSLNLDNAEDVFQDDKDEIMTVDTFEIAGTLVDDNMLQMYKNALENTKTILNIDSLDNQINQINPNNQQEDSKEDEFTKNMLKSLISRGSFKEQDMDLFKQEIVQAAKEAANMSNITISNEDIQTLSESDNLFEEPIEVSEQTAETNQTEETKQVEESDQTIETDKTSETDKVAKTTTEKGQDKDSKQSDADEQPKPEDKTSKPKPEKATIKNGTKRVQPGKVNNKLFPNQASALLGAGQLFIAGNPKFKNVEFVGLSKTGPEYAYYILENKKNEHVVYVYNRKAKVDENHPIEFRPITEEELKDKEITSESMRRKVNNMKKTWDIDTVLQSNEQKNKKNGQTQSDKQTPANKTANKTNNSKPGKATVKNNKTTVKPGTTNAKLFPNQKSALLGAGQLFVSGNKEFKNVEFVGLSKTGPEYAYYILENKQNEHLVYVYNRKAKVDKDHPVEFRQITEEELKNKTITSDGMRKKVNDIKNNWDNETLTKANEAQDNYFENNKSKHIRELDGMSL